MEVIVVQLLIVYSVNVLLAVTAFSLLAQFFKYFLHTTVDLSSTNYDNILFLSDFNAEVENNFLKEFCNLFGMKSLIWVPTCYNNLPNPTCIDLILTDSKQSFQNSFTIETRLSDFQIFRCHCFEDLLPEKRSKCY